ncbi:3-deoxy-D-manno-octulosonic acid kinase [Vibrio sp. JPW-9-11-11]|uniref:3-deoxy-D-manno-octulosonic acid kinase n=1 Tax=Vibrio sp. JPW-9-11-11 TaxID=1416532 RepID=UPI0015949896|nr:3-deoxy-D-manno-octulosonic acid kinase [Vibrio sp. JPW-9-11-11]NVD05366.1 3-deoxy-D-manno-octulosonic acid kinase [Vibrio sp. JPW-9-11-11]
MFKQTQINNTTYWHDPLLLTENVEHAFSVDYWQKHNAVTGSARGRGTTWFVQGYRGEFALRHYRRGGLFGKLIKDSYWFTSLEDTRAYQELKLLRHLIECNVSVPAPVAARVTKSGLTYQADIIVQRISNANDLVGLLSQQVLSKDLFKKVGREIKKMHDANVNHTDLNIHNILIDQSNQVWLIDFDKCKREEIDNGWKQSNLERLKRSFDKEVRLGNIQLPDYAWTSLEEGYKSNK